MFIADTDVLIDYLRGRGPGARRIQIELSSRHLATTVVTAFELWAGVRGKRQESAVGALLDAMDVVPLDAAGARSAAAVRRALDDDGAPIGMADSLIAGITMQRRGTLITRNLKHFQRVDGLKLATLSLDETD